MPGPVPKPASQRQRRNKVTTNATLEAPPATKIELPTRYSRTKCTECYLSAGKHTETLFDREEIEPHDFDPAVEQWRDLTLLWWGTIWDSPMADEWVDADVPGLVALAFLVDEFWRTGSREVHAEIRMASREFGLSPLSRRQLQWEIKKLAPTPAARPPTPRRRNGRAVLSVLSSKTA